MLTAPLSMPTGSTVITTPHISKPSPFRAFGVSVIFAQREPSVVPRHLLIHNTDNTFRTDWIADVYRAVGAANRLRVETEAVSEPDIAAWLVK